MTGTATASAPRKSKGGRKSGGASNGARNGTLARRVARLERDVADLHARLAAAPEPAPAPAKDWRRTIGMFSGDELMKEIDEYARQFREADRRRARRGRPEGKSRKAKT